MRIGLIGPAGGDTGLLEQATEFLIGDADADLVVYLGIDDAAETLARRHAPNGSGDLLNDQLLGTAIDGSPEEIRSVIEAHRRLRRMSRFRLVPKPPRQAVEMIDDRVMVMVYDKGHLDEDDIVNSNIIVYGKSAELTFRRFGMRTFFAPGPLRKEKVAILEQEADGRLLLDGYDLEGTPLFREPLQVRAAKVMVAP